MKFSVTGEKWAVPLFKFYRSIRLTTGAISQVAEKC